MLFIAVHIGVYFGGHETHIVQGLHIPAHLGPDGLRHNANHLTLYTSRRHRQGRRQLQDFKTVPGLLSDYLLIADRVSREVKAISSVRLSGRLSVRLFPLYLLNRLTFEPQFVYVCGS